jgi:hypothetical protein
MATMNTERTFRKTQSDETLVNEEIASQSMTMMSQFVPTLPRTGVRRARSDTNLNGTLQIIDARDYLLNASMVSQPKPRKIRRIHSDISQDATLMRQEMWHLGKQWVELQNLTVNQKNRIQATKEAESDSCVWFCHQCGITEKEAPNIEWVSGPQGPNTLCHCCGWLFSHKISKQQQYFRLYEACLRK